MIDYKTYLKQMPEVFKNSMTLVVIFAISTFILIILGLEIFLPLILKMIVEYNFLKKQLLANDENGKLAKGLLKSFIVGYLVISLITFIGVFLWILISIVLIKWNLLFIMTLIGTVYLAKIFTLRVFYSIYVASITDAAVIKLIFTGKFGIIKKFKIIALSEILIGTVLLLGLFILLLSNAIPIIIITMLTIVIGIISITIEFTGYYFIGKDALANYLVENDCFEK